MITALSDDLSKKRGLPEYELVYNRLHQFIEDVNEKIVGRIQLVQQVYLEDYKEQVSKMAAELRQIRSVLDEELLRQRCTHLTILSQWTIILSRRRKRLFQSPSYQAQLRSKENEKRQRNIESGTLR